MAFENSSHMFFKDFFKHAILETPKLLDLKRRDKCNVIKCNYVTYR